MVLIAAALSFGIVFGKDGGPPVLIFIVLFLGFLLYSIFKNKNENIKAQRLALFFLIILSFLFGLIRIRDTKELFEDSFFPEKAIKNVRVNAVVKDISFGKDQYILILENSLIKEPSIPSEGLMMVYSDSLDGAKAGDHVIVKGTLYSFSPATNDGQFDQRDYYMSKGITLKIYADELEVVKRNNTIKGIVKDCLFEMSMEFQNGLKKVFNDVDMGILSAMLIGNRSELNDTVRGLYQRIGIAHILSISGMHITLIGMGLFGLLMKLSKRLHFSIFCSMIILFMYGLLTGFSVSTVRACLMLSFSFAARIFGKAYDGQSAAGTAAVVILAINPLEIYESGFQLSFIAVFGIFAGNEIRKNLGLRNKILIYLLPALSAQISTLPIILRTYYSFSLYSVIANIIFLPFLTIIVISGFCSGIFSCAAVASGSDVLMLMAKVAAGPAHFVLSGYEKVSEWLLDLPGADIITGCPEIIRCLVFYSMLFVIVAASLYIKIKSMKAGIVSGSSIDIKKKEEKKKKTVLSMYAVCICMMVFVLLFRGGSSGLYSGFLDVGQGLSVYIEADGKSMLFDGGSSNIKNVGKYRIEPYLLWRGVSEIEYCFISHTDEDHISGILELIESGRIKIRNLVLGSTNGESEPLAVLARDSGIRVLYVKAGDKIISSDDIGEKVASNDDIVDKEYESGSIQKDDLNPGSLDIEVLSPDLRFIYEDKNQASLVIMIRYKDISILLTGDSDVYAESEYVRYLDSSVNILQCPHHGSKYSCSELLLEKASPDITVISCSKTNVYGHPAPETLDRIEKSGSVSYVTSKNGMVTIEYRESGKYRVRKFLE